MTKSRSTARDDAVRTHALHAAMLVATLEAFALASEDAQGFDSREALALLERCRDELTVWADPARLERLRARVAS